MCYRTFSYNLTVAKTFGVCTATLISLLENKYSEYITLQEDTTKILMSRDFIFNSTALDVTKQLEIENLLKSCGILQVKPHRTSQDKIYYTYNRDLLTDILKSNCNMVIEPLSPPSNKPVKERGAGKTKLDKHKEDLKKHIKTKDGLTRQYLCDWVDAVYSNPKGFLSRASIDIAEQLLCDWSDAERLEILKIAIVGGHRDLQWSIDEYRKRNDKTGINFNSYDAIKFDSSNTNLSEEEF